MGRALEPGVPVELVLDWDMDKPPQSRPVFISKALSIRGRERLAAAYDAFFETLRSDEGTAERLVSGTLDLLELFILDWRNQKDPETGEEIPFSRDAFKDVLTQAEAFELVRKAISGTEPTTEEKKS